MTAVPPAIESDLNSVLKQIRETISSIDELVSNEAFCGLNLTYDEYTIYRSVAKQKDLLSYRVNKLNLWFIATARFAV